MKKVLTNIAIAAMYALALSGVAIVAAVLLPIELYVQHHRSKTRWVVVRK